MRGGVAASTREREAAVDSALISRLRADASIRPYNPFKRGFVGEAFMPPVQVPVAANYPGGINPSPTK